MRASDSLCAGGCVQVICESGEISHGHLVDGLFPSDGFRSFNKAIAFDVTFRFLRSLDNTLNFNIANHLFSAAVSFGNWPLPPATSRS